MMYYKTWLAWLYIILNGMTVLQPHLLSKMFSFIFSFHLVATVILSHCTSCRFSFHVFSCCCSGRMNFSMADLKVDMAFCSFLVFLPEKYYFPAFSFASSPPLKPKHFFHDHYLLYEWIHFYIIWKDFRANLLKKSQKERKKRKKPRAWVKLYNGYFSPLTLFFLPVIFVLLTQSFMTRALTWINLNQPLKFLLLHHCAQAKKNERQIRIVTSVVFGCFPPYPEFLPSCAQKSIDQFFSIWRFWNKSF